MTDMVLFWQIVPTDDGCRYLYKDKDGHYQLRYKSDGLPDNDFLLFNTEEEATDYINANLDPTTYKAEWIVISQNRLSEWKRENCIPEDEDEECDSAAEEAHDNLVRSLVEAGGEICELKNDKKRLIFTLKEAVTWLDYFLTTERNDIYYDEANEVRCRAEHLLIDMEDIE